MFYESFAIFAPILSLLKKNIKVYILNSLNVEHHIVIHHCLRVITNYH